MECLKPLILIKPILSVKKTAPITNQITINGIAFCCGSPFGWVITIGSSYLTSAKKCAPCSITCSRFSELYITPPSLAKCFNTPLTGEVIVSVVPLLLEIIAISSPFFTFCPSGFNHCFKINLSFNSGDQPGIPIRFTSAYTTGS